jgi:hypothetical protein
MALVGMVGVLLAQEPAAPQQAPAPEQQQQQAPMSPQQLEDLVAPIALYPDPLLGQILAASTYPLELIEAQQWMQQNRNLTGQALIDAARQQNWDPSVQALVALPDVLNRLTSDVRWTTELGNAFLSQQADVMAAVQRMRSRAQANGKLQPTPQQNVVVQDQGGQQAIQIVPANPNVVYVPEYNPLYVWGPPVYGVYPPLWYPGIDIGFAFGPGIEIGAFFPGWGVWGWGGWGWGFNWFGGGLIASDSTIGMAKATAYMPGLTTPHIVWACRTQIMSWRPGSVAEDLRTAVDSRIGAGLRTEAGLRIEETSRSVKAREVLKGEAKDRHSVSVAQASNNTTLEKATALSAGSMRAARRASKATTARSAWVILGEAEAATSVAAEGDNHETYTYQLVIAVRDGGVRPRTADFSHPGCSRASSDPGCPTEQHRADECHFWTAGLAHALERERRSGSS